MLKLSNFCPKTYNLQSTRINVIITNIYIDVLYINILYIHIDIFYMQYICICILHIYHIYVCVLYICILHYVLYIYMYYVAEKTNNVPCVGSYQSANGLVVTHGLGGKMTHNA